MPKWRWLFKQLTKKLWYRIIIFFMLGIFTAVFSFLLKEHIPAYIAINVGADAVDNILNIIATSMLAVTTFSLSIMVSAYASASSNATPRATKLLLEDGTTQNALSVFIGSFVFSLVGIVSLRVGLYGSSGRLVLLIVTIGVIALIILVFIKWIDYLSRLGRLSETIKMIELSTQKAFLERLKKPYMGCHKLTNADLPDEHYLVEHPEIGYVQNIDISKVSTIANAAGIKIYIFAVPGTFNDAHHPIAALCGSVEENVITEIRNTFSIHRDRTFEQDPRYGCMVLNEIALRGLSPAVNDQGTAISIIDHMVRLLEIWICFEHQEQEITHKNVYVPEITVEQLMYDCFYTIMRDGADKIEINIRLQQAFKSVAGFNQEKYSKLAMKYSARCFERSQTVMSSSEDITIIKNHLLE